MLDGKVARVGGERLAGREAGDIDLLEVLILDGLREMVDETIDLARERGK